jgi:hypothetical protein
VTFNFNLKFKFRVHGSQWPHACSGPGLWPPTVTPPHLFNFKLKASISSVAFKFKFKPLASPARGRRRPARREVTSARPPTSHRDRD